MLNPDKDVVRIVRCTRIDFTKYLDPLEKRKIRGTRAMAFFRSGYSKILRLPGKPLSIHFYFAAYFKFSLLTYRNSACNRISRSNLNIFMFVKILESDSGIPILSFISIFQTSSKDRSLKSVEEEGFPRLFFFRSTDDSAGWTSNVTFFRRRGAPRASTGDIFGATTRSNCPWSHRRCGAGYLSPLIFFHAPAACFLLVFSSSASASSFTVPCYRSNAFRIARLKQLFEK